ncbi:hypothetical protein EXN37_03100 [Clostridium botulinum]|nr:hypothetical protein [Clostridium botulinum]NFJ82926.1 hypothetical protein [Clostridium botulinum]
MEGEGKWANPEEFFLAFRCTSVQYAENFLNKGQIKFNTPNSWVKYAFEKGEGRGDKLEGTIATFRIDDIEHMIELNKKYKYCFDLKRMIIDKRVYLKRARDMSLLCFCFYVLKQDMFKCPNEEGKHKLTTTIPSSYFKDFMDNLEPCEVEKLDENDKPAVIIIYNYPEFEKRIVRALMKIGLKREEIIIERVLYKDLEKFGRDGWWDFCQKPPMELAIKDKRFKSQSEARIIINTDDMKIKNKLKKPIEIGPLRDIACISYKYSCEGMSIELNAELKLSDSINSRKENC